jgi:hypothetical protein
MIVIAEPVSINIGTSFLLKIPVAHDNVAQESAFSGARAQSWSHTKTSAGGMAGKRRGCDGEWRVSL